MLMLLRHRLSLTRLQQVGLLSGASAVVDDAYEPEWVECRFSRINKVRRDERRPYHGLSQKTSQPPLDAFPRISEQLRARAKDPKDIPAGPKSAITNYTLLRDLQLPISCPGCGALSQESFPDEAGYYTRSRKAVKNYLRLLRDTRVVPTAAENADANTSPRSLSTKEGDFEETNVAAAHLGRTQDQQSRPNDLPVCQRCHDLVYNSKGASIAHPSLEALADSIAESPFRRNHVYHIVDAADFPMSLIPSIYRSLSLAKPRSQNRRSQHDFSRKPTLSFVITRSDILAPTKEKVDSLMPYFTSTLRQALGKSAEDVRLGNVHLVSAKRGWWTADIKDDIWKRGGGNWLVGKVNVGKSNLFEVLFPKGSGERAPSYAELAQDHLLDQPQNVDPDSYTGGTDILSEVTLLPPAQPENAFPSLPLVSSLPGTTASPIRLPFGKHRGELIDLPGLARGELDKFVQPERKLDLVMTHRPNTTQHIVKPGQSLLLGGGLIRMTPILDPADPSSTMLAYPFVPLDAHVTSTQKAVNAQLQERGSGIKTLLAHGAGERMRLAGKFKLDTDVTRGRAKTLLAAGVSVSKLPFRVYSTDVLIEGVGWVELVCQVRRRRVPTQDAFPHAGNEIQVEGSRFTPFARAESILDLRAKASSTDEQPDTAAAGLDHNDTSHAFQASTSSEPSPSPSPPPPPPSHSNDEFPVPVVEIYSPNGSYVGKRKPMGAWLLLESGRKKKASKAAAGARPRRSMKGAKKREKLQRRAREDVTATSSVKA